MLEGVPDGPRRPRQGQGGADGEHRVYPLRRLRGRLPGGCPQIRVDGEMTVKPPRREKEFNCTPIYFINATSETEGR